MGQSQNFCLFKLDEKGQPTLELNNHGGYFDLAPTDLGENCRRDFVLDLEEMRFDVEASHHEVAPGQHEIDFKYANALTSYDNIQTFKLVLKTIARKHELHATFIPKPLLGGMVLECIIVYLYSKMGKMHFTIKMGNQSETARQFIAGLLAHAEVFTAITNPTVNSYKRLVPGCEAPCYVAWSARNRSLLIRIPASRGLSTRIEVRSVAPSANPYLAMATLLKAGLDGIKNKLTPPATVDLNIYTMNKEERLAEGITDLPTTLAQASIALSKDETIISLLGYVYMSILLKPKILNGNFKNPSTSLGKRWKHEFLILFRYF